MFEFDGTKDTNWIVRVIARKKWRIAFGYLVAHEKHESNVQGRSMNMIIMHETVLSILVADLIL